MECKKRCTQYILDYLQLIQDVSPSLKQDHKCGTLMASHLINLSSYISNDISNLL